MTIVHIYVVTLCRLSVKNRHNNLGMDCCWRKYWNCTLDTGSTIEQVCLLLPGFLYIWYFLIPAYLRNFWFIFNYVSSDVRVETETYVYPLMSFVSEFGGGLGLFLGFSFLTFWDGFQYIFSEIKNMKMFSK